MTERPGPPRRGLVMVSDPDLLDTLLRLAAAAGCELQRAVDPPQARAFWNDAPLVLLDATAAAQCARAGLPRRGDVVLAVRGEPPATVWRHAVAVGAEHVVALEGGRVPAAALHAALPSPRVGRREGGLGVLSCDRSTRGPAPAAVRAVVEAGRRAGDTVVCDLPRYPTDAAAAALAVADLV